VNRSGSTGRGSALEPTRGRCWNGQAMCGGQFRCHGRIPTHGEVCHVMEGPYRYPQQTREDIDDLERGAGEKDRKAAAVVFTYEGWTHILKSPDLGGTSMLTEVSKVKIEPYLHVFDAFAVDEGKRLLICADFDPDWYGDKKMGLLEYPAMTLVKKWDESDGNEFREDIRMVDFFEEFLVVLFHNDERPSTDTRLCCYAYGGENSTLEKVADWDLSVDELSDLQTRGGRICDLCVSAGGGVGAHFETLSYNGLVRSWRADSIAGCTAILNGSLDNLGGEGKVGGLSLADSGAGTIRRVPRVMQEQLTSYHDLDNVGLDVVTCHRDTVAFWQTCYSKIRIPEQVMVIRNPMADGGRVSDFVMDEGLTNGICVQQNDSICMDYEDEGKMDVTQLVVWSPFKKSANIAFEIPAEYELSTIRFAGGRLLITSGLEDARKGSARGETPKYGGETCYLYVVSAREDEASLPSRNVRIRLGIDSSGVPGMLENLLAGTSPRDFPRGVNITIAIPHACPGEDGFPSAVPKEVRPCCHLCHGCGRFVCFHNLRACTGCKGALYCSKGCQKKAWPMHKPTCKGVQLLMNWFEKKGYCTGC